MMSEQGISDFLKRFFEGGLASFLRKEAGLACCGCAGNQTPIANIALVTDDVGIPHSLAMLALLKVDSVVLGEEEKNGHAYLSNVSERCQQVDVRGSRSFD